MISYIISFLVMLNPFAMFLYLSQIMKQLSDKNFRNVLFKASLISFGIFLIFLLFGDFLLNNVFQIGLESFRIFGGIIIFSIAYLFIIKGQKAFITIKEDLDDLAEEIALPFMVGAGTLSLTLLMGQELLVLKSFFSLLIILTINFGIIILLKYLRDKLKKRNLQIAFDKNMEILLRLNGFFLGSIGINMIIIGVNRVFF